MANHEHTRDRGGVPALRPAYLGHPGLKAYAEARRHIEATPLDDPHYDRAVATRVTAADDAANDLYATPAKSVDDVIAKLVAVIADFNGGKIEPDDPNFLQAVYDDLPPTGDGMDAAPILAGIVRELVELCGAGAAGQAPVGQEAWDAALERFTAARRAEREALALLDAAGAEGARADHPLNVAWEKADDLLCEAHADLMRLAAPDAKAIADKMRFELARAHNIDVEDFDTSKGFAEAMSDCQDDGALLVFAVYQDAVRLASIDSPVLDVPLRLGIYGSEAMNRAWERAKAASVPATEKAGGAAAD